MAKEQGTQPDSRVPLVEQLKERARLAETAESIGSVRVILAEIVSKLGGAQRDLRESIEKTAVFDDEDPTAELETRKEAVEEKLAGQLYEGLYLIETLQEILEEKIPGLPFSILVDILERFSKKLVPESPEDIRERLGEDEELTGRGLRKTRANTEDLLLVFVRKAFGASLTKLTPEQSRLLMETAQEITDSFSEEFSIFV